MLQLNSYESRREWGDSSMDNIRQLIATAKGYQVEDLIIADDHIDKNQATDLVHTPSGYRFAVRCRQTDYIKDFYGQWTCRMSGETSEFDKLQWAGGSYDYFYSFKDKGGKLLHWWLFAINTFAFENLIEEVNRPEINSHFRAFEIPRYVVASSESLSRWVADSK